MEEPTIEAMWAVVAHGLLNTMAAISGAALTLRRNRHKLDEGQFAMLLSLIEDQASLASGMLKDVVRGLPPATMEALESMRGPAPSQPSGG